MSDRTGDTPMAASGNEDPGQVLRATTDPLVKLRLDQSLHVQGLCSATNDIDSVTHELSSLHAKLAAELAAAMHDRRTTNDHIGVNNAASTSVESQPAMAQAKGAMTQAEKEQIMQCSDEVLKEWMQLAEKLKLLNEKASAFYLAIADSHDESVTPELRRWAQDKMNKMKGPKEQLDVATESLRKVEGERGL